MDVTLGTILHSSKYTLFNVGFIYYSKAWPKIELLGNLCLSLRLKKYIIIREPHSKVLINLLFFTDPLNNGLLSRRPLPQGLAQSGHRPQESARSFQPKLFTRRRHQ